MIIPNLLVTDMGASIAFYRDTLGFELTMALDTDRAMHTDPEGKAIVFATLAWKEAQLMLQTAASLADDLDLFTPASQPAASGTIYLRGFDPDTIDRDALGDAVLKAPFLQWYGMKELYLKDPNGYVLCLGIPEGAPPA
ncbi:MAG: VOC family protein [Pseudomonadota bacterium]